MNPASYLAEIHSKLISSPVILDSHIVSERLTQAEGFIRARLILRNGDFLEIAEYFEYDGATSRVHTYTYQWMNSDKTKLRRRWDNAPHFPNLPGFPDHVHLENEDDVAPARRMNTCQLIDAIERELNM